MANEEKYPGFMGKDKISEVGCNNNIEQVTIKQDVYKLGLHESMTVADYFITRVPGGWLYRSNQSYTAPLCFVPFDNGFQEIKRFSLEDIIKEHENDIMRD